MMVFERATLRPENVQIGGHFKGQLQQDLLDGLFLSKLPADSFNAGTP